MLTAFSAIVAMLCTAASLCRLRWAVEPTALDPAALRRVFAAEDGWAVVSRLREALAGNRELAWEHELLAAFTEPTAAAREARVNEQLTELDGRAERWSRVPRVCASIATSAGFLFATITLLRTMAPAVSAVSSVSSVSRDRRSDEVVASLAPALDTLAVGIAGASFCAAVHVRARTARRQRLSATDRWVERLRTLAARADAGEECARGTRGTGDT
jgi:hypothetical protein